MSHSRGRVPLRGVPHSCATRVCHTTVHATRHASVHARACERAVLASASTFLSARPLWVAALEHSATAVRAACCAPCAALSADCCSSCVVRSRSHAARWYGRSERSVAALRRSRARRQCSSSLKASRQRS
eukprot:5022512-Prymnesium_polylepis.1